MKFTTTLDVPLTIEQLAGLFADLDDDSQAKFFVDGVLVGTAAIAALTSTTGLVQPYIAVERSNGSGLGALRVDYVRVWAKRP